MSLKEWTLDCLLTIASCNYKRLTYEEQRGINGVSRKEIRKRTLKHVSSFRQGIKWWMLWLFLTVCIGLASEVKDAWNEGNMQEEPPAVCHPAVRGHFSWALPQGTWLIGLDGRDAAHECSSHLYSSFIMHHGVQRCWSRTCLSLLWILFKTNYLISQNISSRCSD